MAQVELIPGHPGCGPLTAAAHTSPGTLHSVGAYLPWGNGTPSTSAEGNGTGGEQEKSYILIFSLLKSLIDPLGQFLRGKQPLKL